MINIDQIDWGKIEVDGQEYRQVLIIGDEVLERDDKKLHQLFNTTHQIGDWEEELLFSGKPEVIVIGNGFDGVLGVSEELKAKSEKLGTELKILKTPQAVEEFNRFSEAGKKVNALIHTTC
ncbi:MAG TPA: MTH938/NDUFAF3 family protein [Desulfobacterales bacterium]|nr:MTH938/NDUFAF3 family protein [Desulfobacterales bacterium]